MKPAHLNFVILLCFATAHLSSGYKPLRGTQGNAVSEPIDPENPPPEHGKSVYDPDIYNKYAGIQFEDQIEEEETEKDTSPNLPSYPWRGGGHVPMPLDDPDALNAPKEVEYLIGFRNCDEILGDSPDVFKDASEDDEGEEEDEKVDADRGPAGETCCKKNEYPDDDSESDESDEGEEEKEAVDADGSGDKEEKIEESQSKTRCEGCSGYQDANSFVLRGVGAVPVIGGDYLDNALAPGATAADAALVDQPDNTYKEDLYGEQDPSSLALSGADVASLIGKDYLDNALAPGATAADDTFGDSDHYYPHTNDLYKKASYVDLDPSSFALSGVDSASVDAEDNLDNAALTTGDTAAVDTFGGGDQPGDYYPYSDDQYGEVPHMGQDPSSSALSAVDAADKTFGGNDHYYPHTNDLHRKASYVNLDPSSFALSGVDAASVVRKDYLDNAALATGGIAADDTFGGGDQPDDHYYPYTNDLYRKAPDVDLDPSSFALSGVDAASVVNAALAPGAHAADDTYGTGDQPDDYYPYSDDLYGGAPDIGKDPSGFALSAGDASDKRFGDNDHFYPHTNDLHRKTSYVDLDPSSFALSGVDAASVVGKDHLDNAALAPGAHAADDTYGTGEQPDDYYPYSDDLYGEASSGSGQQAGAGADVVAILDGGSSSEPAAAAARVYVYRPGDEGDGEGEGESEEALLRRRLGAEGCRVCAPCCALLAAAEADAPARRARAGECTPDDSERDHVGAECRSCHVRRRPPPLGVVLTCYECATQQADRTCRLGHENVEHAHYRVSAKFFLTTDTNNTGEVTATQHSGMLARQPRQLPAQQMSGRASGSGHTLSTPSFIDSDNKDLYPFEEEEEAEAKDELVEQREDEEEEDKKEQEEKENKKGSSKAKQKKK